MVWPKCSSWNCNLCTEGSPAASGQTTLAPEFLQSKTDYLLSDDMFRAVKFKARKQKPPGFQKKSEITALLKIKSNLIFNALSLQRLNIAMLTDKSVYSYPFSLYLAILLSTVWGWWKKRMQEKGIKCTNPWNLPFSVASAVSRTMKIRVRTSI